MSDTSLSPVTLPRRSVSAPPRIRGPPLLRTCALPPDFPPNSPFTPGVYNLLQFAVTRYYIRSRATAQPSKYSYNLPGASPDIRDWSITKLKQVLERYHFWARDVYIAGESNKENLDGGLEHRELAFATCTTHMVGAVMRQDWDGLPREWKMLRKGRQWVEGYRTKF